MKKTKIIASIGPSSNEVPVFEKMVLNGVDVARINFSHAGVKEREQAVNTIKKVREKLQKNIAILYDTKGPEFRNGIVQDGGIRLKEDNTIKVVKDNVIGDENRFSVNHPEVLKDLNIGDIILLENGLMKIEVISKDDEGVTCKIINGGNFRK